MSSASGPGDPGPLNKNTKLTQNKHRKYTKHMQIKKLLEIERIIGDRKIPCDMDTLNLHKSQSTGKEIKLVDMHLPHLLRAYSRLIDTWDEREGYNDGWNDALESLKK